MAPVTDPEAKARRRRRVALGEAIGIAALLISGLGLWNSWRNGDDKPAVVIDRAPKPIALVLRGKLADDGKVLNLTPLESGHALDELVITARAPAKGSAPFGSDPMLSAAMVETWLPPGARREGSGSLAVDTVARYVEAGETRTARQRYRIDYLWKDGGLFSGKSLRLTGFRRA
jgi:hypothetical protein